MIECHSFVQTAPVVLDPVQLSRLSESYRKRGDFPINLAPVPTLLVLHRRLGRVRINVIDFDPERHDKIEGEPIHDLPRAASGVK